MSNFEEILVKEFSEEGIDLTDAQIESFVIYKNLLVEWNEKMNLTTILDDEGIVIKHFLDSAMFLKYATPNMGDSLVDVGTGAGFPAVPILILRGDLKVTLIDASKKRIAFLENLLKELKLPAKTVWERGEDAGRNIEYRDSFDFATARAVTKTRQLTELILPLVKFGGRMVALKGPDIEEEIKESEKAIFKLGGEIKSINNFFLPGDQQRNIVIIKKIKGTPGKYPRNWGKIKNSPI